MDISIGTGHQGKPESRTSGYLWRGGPLLGQNRPILAHFCLHFATAGDLMTLGNHYGMVRAYVRTGRIGFWQVERMKEIFNNP